MVAFVFTAGQRLSVVTGKTGAGGDIVDDCAFGVGSARTGVTGLLWIDSSARSEGVSTVVMGTATDWYVVANLTFGVYSALSSAWIDALVISTSSCVWALRVILTLAPLTATQGVSMVTGQTRTDGSAG